MSVTVEWDNPEKTILRYNFIGKWTWEEFHVAMDQAVTLRTGVPHKVDIIANLEVSAGLPPNTLSQLRRVFKVAGQNRGLTVIAGGNMLSSALVDVFLKLNPNSRGRVAVARSVKAAREMLLERQKQRQRA